MTSTTVTPAAGPDPAAGTGVPTAASDAPLAHADGVELIGNLDGSGYREPPALVRRADGQTIQLTPLLYSVLQAIDGRRSPDEVAARVSDETGRHVTAGNITTLVDGKLRPLGLLRRADGSQPTTRKANPLLALRLKYVVTDPARTRALTAPFAPLFAPAVVTVLTLAFLATSSWVLFEKGLAAATHEAFDKPGLLLLVFAVTVLSAGFHEFGHAAACRYGGATPGAMGAGLYLVWPAFYTDVTDSYRLGRAGRVRVDLGGLYFNAIFAVAMFGFWAVTRFDALLLIIATQVLQMIRQLAPFVRFDGYHILADLTGVPDLYSHIKPTLMGLLPTHWRKPEGRALKPWARAVVSTWVLVVVPLLLGSLALVVLAFPRVAATAWDSLGRQWGVLVARMGEGDPVGITRQILAILAIALPVLATVYLVVRVVRRTAAGVWRSTEGRPAARATAAVAGLAVVGALTWAWWPHDDTYEPIRPRERGTVLDAVGVARAQPAAAGLAGSAVRTGVAGRSAAEQRTNRPATRLVEGELGTARTIWPEQREPLPTADEPQLALVLVPSDESSDAPVWVFPFDQPDAPGVGDNQALAVNTTDGATVYDVAFALVWADGDTVLNRNEAYAFASCRGCTTIAVGFQVVLVVGQADVIVPQNLSAAVNYNCVDCLTYALAQQLVVTLPEGLSEEAMSQLDAIWAEVVEYGATIQSLPLEKVQDQLAAYEQQILDIVRADAAAAGVATSTPPPTQQTPSGSAAPSDGTTSPSETSPSPAWTSSSVPVESSPSPTGTGSPMESASSAAP